ncbi:unnamed protein product [Penicillium olsonii]|nr:unnamed protein product [Penicillium olsonii]
MLDTNEKPFACPCGVSFARKDLLRRHQRLPCQEQRSVGHRRHTYICPALPEESSVGLEYTSVPHVSEAERSAPNASFPVNASSVHEQRPTPQGSSTSHQNSLMSFDIGDDSISSFPPITADYDTVEDFSNFINRMGLSLGWDTELFQESEILPAAHISYTHTQIPDNVHGSALGDLPSSDDHIQSLTILPVPKKTISGRMANYFPAIEITERQRNKMVQDISRFQRALPDVSLPSRHSLTRFLNAFFDGVHPHFPFIHPVTFQMQDCIPELLLAMAAIGAQYRYERKKAFMLFTTAKAILHERQYQEEAASLANAFINRPRSQDHMSTHFIQHIGSLLILVIFATWQESRNMLSEALCLQSRLAQLIKDSGLFEAPASPEPLDWHTWIELESARRVKLSAFCFLNIHSIAYNVPPILLVRDINLRLPCSCQEWLACGENEWKIARRAIPKEQNLFQDAIAILLGRSDQASCIEPVPSPVANYVLLHGLLQYILLSRQSQILPREGEVITMAQTVTLEAALQSWTTGWLATPESSLDPLNPSGPIPFTSTAFLGLAYTRIHVDLGSHRQLETRDPQKIARALLHAPAVPRQRALLPALLHATHALSVPVQLGIDYVSHSQAFIWSIQHVICAVEFAIILNKWLDSVAQTHLSHPLTGKENLKKLYPPPLFIPTFFIVFQRHRRSG